MTINPDGSPQISIVWVGLDGDAITLAHRGTGQKRRTIAGVGPWARGVWR